MTNETALSIFGLMLVPILTWAAWATIMLSSSKKACDKLIYMHEHADEFGFGTVEMRMITKELLIAIRSLTHYIRWSCEKQTGEVPPPPIDG